MDTDDRRSSPFADTSGKLCTSTLYAVLKSRAAEAGSANSAFWRSCAPPRVQFFGWLLIHGRVQCKTSLLQRKVVQDSTRELCNRAPETASHLIFHCAFAASFWQTLGFQLRQHWASKTFISCRDLIQSQRLTSTRSSSSAAGSSGSDEMGSSSDKKRCPCDKRCRCASTKPPFGGVASLGQIDLW
jgi:hypothetical protein